LTGEEDSRGDVEAGAKPLDMHSIEFAAAGEDFRDDAFSAEVFGEVSLTEAVLVDQEAKYFCGGGIGRAVVLVLITLDEEGEEFYSLNLYGGGMVDGGELEERLGVGGELFFAADEMRCSALDHFCGVC
jgi:hypothetical protein